MSVLKNRWMKRLGIGTLALLSLGAVTLRSAPADARVFLSFGYPGYYGYGYGYTPYYPTYGYGYGYGYGYNPYYYGYPYGGATVSFGGGHHHHHR